ncbi:hypothetical protein [Hyphomicrobium sp.]|uniref:hypothetical protein n=1 Tax=Hyphomicrobium sp. TaxID=82 RepID=UPI002E3013FA|nr:hypothetical protein [Hyphomicrobium sp.]HEX2839665.1 hypothetical protein [Hyphomicrobium sp.]
MCDYSLEAYRSRPARKGEQYVTHRFPSHGIGFIAAGDPDTAVCMACDTRLRLENVPERLKAELGVTSEEVVDFVRIDEGQFHDGVRFRNGVEITLQHLGPFVKGCVIEDAQPVLPQRETVAAL